MSGMMGMLRQRSGPIMLGTGILGGGWLYGKTMFQAPKEKRLIQEPGKLELSEKLQNLGGTGGKHARKEAHPGGHTGGWDPKDTRSQSSSPDAPSKRSPQKVRSDTLPVKEED